jgi:hypothetical protein
MVTMVSLLRVAFGRRGKKQHDNDNLLRNRKHIVTIVTIVTRQKPTHEATSCSNLNPPKTRDHAVPRPRRERRLTP